ncbi:MAG: hypothetical protein Ct9H90mP18_05470 [Gammaproteobacteria bacterium]|nr:MAG: hypothetical protein Ct9H90mP18_05470 [Gammaproteobacteria bacterium]
MVNPSGFLQLVSFIFVRTQLKEAKQYLKESGVAVRD